MSKEFPPKIITELRLVCVCNLVGYASSGSETHTVRLKTHLELNADYEKESMINMWF